MFHHHASRTPGKTTGTQLLLYALASALLPYATAALLLLISQAL